MYEPRVEFKGAWLATGTTGTLCSQAAEQGMGGVGVGEVGTLPPNCRKRPAGERRKSFARPEIENVDHDPSWVTKILAGLMSRWMHVFGVAGLANRRFAARGEVLYQLGGGGGLIMA